MIAPNPLYTRTRQHTSFCHDTKGQGNERGASGVSPGALFLGSEGGFQGSLNETETSGAQVGCECGLRPERMGKGGRLLRCNSAMNRSFPPSSCAAESSLFAALHRVGCSRRKSYGHMGGEGPLPDRPPSPPPPRLSRPPQDRPGPPTTPPSPHRRPARMPLPRSWLLLLAVLCLASPARADFYEDLGLTKGEGQRCHIPQTVRCGGGGGGVGAGS